MARVRLSASASENALSLEALKRMLRYDPETGLFIWLHGQMEGRRAGAISKAGYIRIKISGRNYLAHRLAWLCVHGRWPDGGIDHRDGDGQNNRIANLRTATPEQNSFNKGGYRNNRVGLKGVGYHAGTGKWRARIRHRGRLVSLGLFATAGEAHEAYVAAARNLFGEFARGQ